MASDANRNAATAGDRPSLIAARCGKPIETVSTPFGRTQRYEFPCVLDPGHDGPCCLAKYDQEEECTAGPNAGSTASQTASTASQTGSRGSETGSKSGVKTDAHVRNRDGSALVRGLAPDEMVSEFAGCFFYAEGRGECGETPVFRVATPHGHFDTCCDHLDGLLALLPPEWIEGWRERDPFAAGEGPDDIPF